MVDLHNPAVKLALTDVDIILNYSADYTKLKTSVLIPFDHNL